MKSSLAAFLFLAAFTTTGAFAADPPPQPASFGDETSLLKRPTPKPDASGSATASKDKKPLTATLAKDNSGKPALTTFAASDPSVYCAWKAETGTKGEKVHIVWFSEGAKDRKLTENTQTIPGNGSITGSAHIEKPAGGFPPGKYRADVFDDGKLARSLKFTITK